MDSESSIKRRKLLKSTLAGTAIAGAALPTQWSKPVIDSLLLPGHAEMSVNFFGSGLSGGETFGQLDPDTGEQYAGSESTVGGEILDSLVQPAQAVDVIYVMSHVHTACAVDMGDDFLVTHQRGTLDKSVCKDELNGPGPQYRFGFRRQGLLPKNGGGGTLSLIASGGGCVPGCNNLTANIVGYTEGDNEITVQISNCLSGSATITIPPASACIFEDLSPCKVKKIDQPGPCDI